MKKELIEFKKFVDKFNIKESGIKYKYNHSIRVMKIGNSIATKLGLSDIEVYMSTLACLLHDLARFDQWKIFKTFIDENSFDHGDYAYGYIKHNNYLRNYTDDDTYDSAILLSIKNHNKFEIKPCSDTELLFSKIVRDADKVDILLNGGITTFTDYKENDFEITNIVFDNIMNQKPIHYKDTNNKMDRVLVSMAMIYDLNFKYSFEFIKGNDVVNNTIMVLKSKCKNKDTLEKLDLILEKLNNYIKETNY